MATDYSADELLEFLQHAADTGLMPAATARALAVASRRVVDILSDKERADVRTLDVAAVVKRFANKRARDFTPTSITEYGRRFQRAIALFIEWRSDPAAFSVPTRATVVSRAQARAALPHESPVATASQTPVPAPHHRLGSGYESSFPVRAGVVVTISNIPVDLTGGEAERLAQFVRLLSLE